MDVKNKAVNQFNLGMEQDILPKLQPEGTYRFALNAVLETREGLLGSCINDLGNTLCITLPGDYLGAVQIDDDTFVVFSVDGTTSHIGIYDPIKCEYTDLVQSTCLGFNKKYPIDAKARIRRGCDRVVYFTDNFNPYRYLNIDNLDAFKTDGVFDCDKFNFDRDLTVPCIDVDRVDSAGGTLEVGAYQFSIRYLDSNLNATNWFYITRPVTIYDDSQTLNYFDIDGARTLIDGENTIGGVPATNKSISLTLTNLDTTYAYFQIAVLVSDEAVGNVSEVYILPEQSIVDTEMSEVRIENLTTSGITLTTLDDITSDYFSPHLVAAHEIHDNRLFLANVKGKEYDWAAFQQAANNIVVNWTTDTITPFDQNTLGSTKNPLTTYKHQTFIGDEIYALAVEFLFANGTWSPAFHIPGREKTTADQIAILPGDETQHLPTKTSYEKWEVYNTADLIAQTMGYYECPIAYPDSLDCDGDRVYPEGNIRHHKFPCRRDIPIYTTTGVTFVGLNLLGIDVTNVTCPSSDVVGYRILASKHTDGSRTVLDTGVGIGPRGKIEFNPDTGQLETTQWEFLEIIFPIIPQNTELFWLSPKTLMQKRLLNGSYFKLIGAIQNTYFQQTREEYDKSGPGEIRTRIDVSEYIDDYIVPAETYKYYTDNIYVSPRSLQSQTGQFTTDIFNNSYSNTVNAYHLNAEFTTAEGVYLMSNKRYLNAFCNLDTITYAPVHSCPIACGEDATDLFGGDGFISELSIVDIDDVDTSGNNHIFYANHFNRVWTESTINYELRYGGDDCNAIYHSGEDINGYILNKVAVEDANNEDEYILRTSYCEEFYGYNPDLNKVVCEKLNLGLPNNFTYCSDCQNTFPYRVVYSEKSFQEEINDNFRIFKPNNYRDLDGLEGPITELFTDKDRLYATTKRVAMFLPTKPQQVQTNESTVYIGTAEILSLPEDKLSTADISYGGLTNKFALNSTEFGTVWADARSGKVFHLSGELTEISNHGMRNFFEENLGLKLDEYFQQNFDETYPCTELTDPRGIGIRVSYDPRFRRIILHKRDYLPITDYKWDEDGAQFYFIDKVGNNVYIDLDDPQYFENHSYTVSYSFTHKRWTSFHSFLPSWMFNDHRTFYTTIDDKIYEHNTFPFQTYYGTKYDHILEYVVNQNPSITKTFSSIEFMGDVSLYSPTYKHWTKIMNATWDRVHAYTRHQSTGLQNILVKNVAGPFSDVSVTAGTAVAERTDMEWHLNKLRDYSTSHSQFDMNSSRWVDIRNDFFIDKVPTPSLVDFNQSFFELGRLRDEYLTVRLFFKPEEDYRINTDINGLTNRISFRS